MIIRNWEVHTRSAAVSFRKCSVSQSRNWHGNASPSSRTRHYTTPANAQTTVHDKPSHVETPHVPHTTDASQGLVFSERNLPTKHEGLEDFGSGAIPLGRGRGRDRQGGGKGPTSTDPSERILDALTTTAIGLGAGGYANLTYPECWS